jgi:hypothetical protein
MKSQRPFRDPSHDWPGRGRRVLLVLVAVVAASCSRSDRVTVFPVQGIVQGQGKPATGALVVFHPLDASEALQKLRPAGNVDADGKFFLSTYAPRDGAPPGKYRVTVVWASPAQDERPGPDRFGGRYANPKESPLMATVTEGDNHIEPFVLQLR